MAKETIESRVMANVATIYGARKLMSVTALKFYALVLSVVGLATLVSLPNVFTNFVNVANGGVGSIAIFTISAVLGTTLLVQLALVLGAFAAISLVAPVFRSSRVFA